MVYNDNCVFQCQSFHHLMPSQRSPKKISLIVATKLLRAMKLDCIHIYINSEDYKLDINLWILRFIYKKEEMDNHRHKDMEY